LLRQKNEIVDFGQIIYARINKMQPRRAPEDTEKLKNLISHHLSEDLFKGLRRRVRWVMWHFFSSSSQRSTWDDKKLSVTTQIYPLKFQQRRSITTRG